MKTKTIFSVIIILLFLCEPVMTQDMPLETAKKVAKTIYYEMVPDSLKLSPENFVISEVFTKSYNGKPLYYIFNIGNKNGVVLITGQNNVIPVLGYSFKGRYKETGHSPAYIDFMKYYEEQIIYAIENNIQSIDEIAEEWSRLEKGEINSQKSLLTVNHLTQTEWGQGLLL